MSFDGIPSNPNWYDVSLGSEQEQELRGRLQFRGGSRSTSESETASCEGDTTDDSKLKEYEEDQNSATQRLDDSYTYQLGMMFVHGAAKAVSKISDGGKGNRELIKKLRDELDQSRMECDELERQVDNFKQWIAYYENMNSELQNQMERIKQQCSLDCAKLQDKLKNSEIDAKSFREELQKVTEERDAAFLEIKVVQKKLTRMKKQVIEAQQKIAEFKEIASNPILKPAMSDAETQIYNEKTSNELDSNTAEKLLDKLKKKEIDLENATTALRLSLSQGDKLRQRHISTLKMVSSQTKEMTKTRLALTSEMKKAEDLKARLNEEMVKTKDAELQLQQEKEIHTSVLSSLDGTKEMLQEALFDLEQEKSLANQNLIAFKSVKCELELDHLASTIVLSTINSAVSLYQQNIHQKQTASFEDDLQKTSKRLQASENDAALWKERFDILTSELRDKEAVLTECSGRVNNLKDDVQNLKLQLQTKNDSEKAIRSALAASEISLTQAKTMQQQALTDKNKTISLLNTTLQQLKNDNTTLRLHLQKYSRKPPTATAATQTSTHGVQIEVLWARVENAEREKNVLAQRLSLSDQQVAQKQQEISNQSTLITSKEAEIEKMKEEYSQLISAFQASQHELHAKEHHLWFADQECKRLHWECKEQNWRSMELYDENVRLRNYIYAYLANPGAYHTTPHHTKHGGFNSSHVNSHGYSDASNKKYAVGISLETIKENDERPLSALSAASKSSQVIVPPEKDSPSEVSPGQDHSNFVVTDDALSPRSQTSEKNTQTFSCEKDARRHSTMRLDSYQSDSFTLITDKSSLLPENFDDDVFGKPSALQPKERLVGIPMPETIYDRIVAGENIPSWQCDHVFSQDDGYSTSSCHSIKDELLGHHFYVAESADSAISEQSHSDLTMVESEQEEEPHFFVNYRGVQFDMADLSVSKIRNIASSTGAIASQTEMNDFYEFLAKKQELINQSTLLRNSHKLGPTDWLTLKHDV